MKRIIGRWQLDVFYPERLTRDVSKVTIAPDVLSKDPSILKFLNLVYYNVTKLKHPVISVKTGRVLGAPQFILEEAVSWSPARLGLLVYKCYS